MHTLILRWGVRLSSLRFGVHVMTPDTHRAISVDVPKVGFLDFILRRQPTYTLELWLGSPLEASWVTDARLLNVKQYTNGEPDD